MKVTEIVNKYEEWIILNKYKNVLQIVDDSKMMMTATSRNIQNRETSMNDEYYSQKANIQV